MEERLVKQWNQYERTQAYSVLLLFAGLIGGIAAGILRGSISIGGAVFVLGGMICMLVQSLMKRKKKRLLDEYLGSFFGTELTTIFGSKVHTPEFTFSRNKLEQLSLKKGEWETCQAEEEWESCFQGMHFSVANVCLWHSYRVNARETNQKPVFEGVCMLAETKNSDTSYWSVRLRKAGMPPTYLSWSENQLFLAFDGKSGEISQTQRGFSCPCAVTKFAQIPEDLDVKNIEDLKEAFRRSLQPVLEVLEILIQKQQI